jgi:hypothetical protein
LIGTLEALVFIELFWAYDFCNVGITENPRKEKGSMAILENEDLGEQLMRKQREPKRNTFL